MFGAAQFRGAGGEGGEAGGIMAEGAAARAGAAGYAAGGDGGYDWNAFDAQMAGEVSATGVMLAQNTAQNPKGYLDLNGSLGSVGIVTGGLAVDSHANNFIYLGAGVGLPGPGFAVTGSPYAVSEGLNVALQIGYFGGGQFGYSFENSGSFFDGFYWEAGVVSPGVSLTGFYVYKLPR